jgi:hypothetical protein
VRAVEGDVQDPAGNAGVDDRGDFMTVLAGDLDGERVDVARVCRVVPGFQFAGPDVAGRAPRTIRRLTQAMNRATEEVHVKLVTASAWRTASGLVSAASHS